MNQSKAINPKQSIKRSSERHQKQDYEIKIFIIIRLFIHIIEEKKRMRGGGYTSSPNALYADRIAPHGIATPWTIHKTSKARDFSS